MHRTNRLKFWSIQALYALFLRAMIRQWSFPMHINETLACLQRTLSSKAGLDNLTPCELENLFAALSEGKRDAARTALNAYRTTVFPDHQGRINHYLLQFGAGFQLDSVTSQAIKGGSSDLPQTSGRGSFSTARLSH